MEITIATGSMAFGPDTPSRRSLGGSETAALMLGKALAARGHSVTHFCNLPPHGASDHWPSGEKHADGVRYVSLAHFQQFASVNKTDLLIVTRDPNLIAFPAQARKKVLWMHDIATVRGMKRALEQMQFTFDEIWTVSEWHKYQVCETTQYPENRVFALRNGIVKYDHVTTIDRAEKTILYASRPERGLDNLIRPGGVMEHLPDYKLIVAFYDHFPDHMREYYEGIFARMKQMPNVEFIGPQSNYALREIIANSAAYIYPTQFEETSCILARECVEQQTPFITTSVGALPETLGDCGLYFEEWLHFCGFVEPERGSVAWCKLFSMFFRDMMADKSLLAEKAALCAARTDLYWDGVAAMAEERGWDFPKGTEFSRLYSLMQDGDIIPAMAYAKKVNPLDFELDDMSAPMEQKMRELAERYDFINGDIAAYYDEIYRSKGGSDESELHFETEFHGQRQHAIAEVISSLPPGSTVFEYGCGPGHIIGPLAKMFPHLKFVGYDFAVSAVNCVNEGAVKHNLPNLAATATLADLRTVPQFDCVICSEVLEHVVKPWELAYEVEEFAREGGRVIFTTPFGAWEPETYERIGRWKERAHLWEIDRAMMMEMLGPKEGQQSMLAVSGQSPWMRPIGNLIYTYIADHKPTNPIDPLAKALRHYPRETVAAAIIAYNNEDTIVKLLNSLDRKVQFVQIAHGPSTDNTRSLIDAWFIDHPWMGHRIIDVPKIEAHKFGFDDARNVSIQGLDQDFEWFLWIDTDEYLSGDFRKYLRSSSIDGYLVHQHHFTVEPRGDVQIDKPARLCRLDRHYRAFGHIHEHFEVSKETLPGHIQGFGPGICFLLPDVDIGHPGYVNEETRQARFRRNFPFLEWEHEEDTGRKLHKFLWFRDIIHRMRFASPEKRIALAKEGVAYYNDNAEDMAVYGPGMFMALQYLAECNTVLNVGVPLRVGVQLADRNATLEGRFESYEQMERVLKQLLSPEFRERTGKYY